MREINTLLNERWILRSKNPETYYKLKDQYKEYKSFFQEKLGYKVIINPLLIKAEKISGKAHRWMGVREFKSAQTYVFFSLVLMFLEEMEPEEQCVLSQITDYIRNQYPSETPVDWTVYSQRKKLIDVLKFCVEENILKVNDGDASLFSGSQEAVGVLYENTGASKYFMRHFSFDLSEVQSVDDFENMEWQNTEKDRGVIRRHRVYRRLVMEPIVYQEKGDDQDYLYIKNQRSVIEHDIDKYLEGHFHLHKNGALVMMGQNSKSKDCFPDRKNISDIVLQMCNLLRNEIKGTLKMSEMDLLTLSTVKWEQYIQKVISTYGSGWSKTYRELSFGKLKDELSSHMIDFKMISIDEKNNEIIVYPAVGKMIGDYSKEFWAKEGKK